MSGNSQPFRSEAELDQAMKHDAARRQSEEIPIEVQPPIQLRQPAPTTSPADTERMRLREQRRMQLASAAQAALIMHSGYNAAEDKTAAMAVRHADALLVQLEKKH